MEVRKCKDKFSQDMEREKEEITNRLMDQQKNNPPPASS